MDVDTTSTSDTTLIPLIVAIILSALCVTLAHQPRKYSPKRFLEILGISVMSLGGLVAPVPFSRFFLIAILAYAASTLLTSLPHSKTRTASLAQLTLVIISILATLFLDNSFAKYTSLFLALTLIPLPPFHVPFTALVGSSQGPMAGLWLVAWISLGLAEIHDLYSFLLQEPFFSLPWLALGSALYSSLKCLGQSSFRQLLTYATVAHLSLLWGLTTVFSHFPLWGPPFGVTLSLVMTALFLSDHFVERRFGPHTMGTLPGLASSMPRLGTLLMLVISIAVLLPILPVLFGISTMPTLANQEISLIMISCITLIVWMFGSWYFSRLLHLTAFGRARLDIPYTDLKPAETWTLALLLVGAGFSALFS